MSSRPFPVSWKGWFEGEKRPHQQIYVEITILAKASSGGELLIDIYDDSLAFSSYSRVAGLYRGYDFPRQRVLKPNNEPVATSGTLLAGDLVVGNKLVVAPGRPPVVLLVAADDDQCVLLKDTARSTTSGLQNIMHASAFPFFYAV